MAKGSRTGYRGSTGSRVQQQYGSISQSHTTVNVLPKSSVSPANVISTTGNYAKMSDNDAQTLRNTMDNYYNSDVTDAIKFYISKTDVHGDGYSYSQNLNYKLDNNLQLDQNEKFIDRFLTGGMHPLGQNYEITRYAHDDLLKQLGISNYAKMSEQQLKKRLIGQGYQQRAYTSYSYDTSKNPFRPGAIGGNGRELTIVTRAKGDTKAVFGAKAQAELVLNKGTKHRIVDVYYDGTTATPRGRSSMPRLVIVTETE